MKKIHSLLLIVFFLQHPGYGQKKYYGICEYKISGGNAYISTPMLINNELVKAVGSQTGTAKYTLLENSLKKTFTSYLASNNGITVNDSYPNEYDALVNGNYNRVLADCDECMWTYEQATAMFNDQTRFLALRNYNVVVVNFTGNPKGKTEEVKDQQGTAYAYYFVNKSINGKDYYIFTTPRSFKYIKDSSYVFNPLEFEKLAEQAIGNKLRSLDLSFDGLNVNQVSNGGNTSLKDLQNTRQEIKNKMRGLYRAQQQQNRQGPVQIMQIDMNTGSTIEQYALAASNQNTNKRSVGNAN